MTASWWTQVQGSQFAQGDLLPDCRLPIFADPTPTEDDSPREVDVQIQRLIVVTQSCDLENNKIDFVASAQFTRCRSLPESIHIFADPATGNRFGEEDFTACTCWRLTLTPEITSSRLLLILGTSSACLSFI